MRLWLAERGNVVAHAELETYQADLKVEGDGRAYLRRRLQAGSVQFPVRPKRRCGQSRRLWQPVDLSEAEKRAAVARTVAAAGRRATRQGRVLRPLMGLTQGACACDNDTLGSHSTPPLEVGRQPRGGACRDEKLVL